MSLGRMKVIKYITDMSRQMNVMATKADSPFLAFLLDMVAKEGQNILKGVESKRDSNQ